MRFELVDLVVALLSILGSGGGGAYLMRRHMVRNGHNPGNPAGLTKGEREALYGIKKSAEELVKVLCAKDDFQQPLIFKIPNQNHALLKKIIKGLERVKPGCTAGEPGA